MEKRKIRVYEYATKDFGKGYIYAKNEKSALNKIKTNKINIHKDISLSYYDKVYRKKDKKYNGIW